MKNNLQAGDWVNYLDVKWFVAGVFSNPSPSPRTITLHRINTTNQFEQIVITEHGFEQFLTPVAN